MTTIIDFVKTFGQVSFEDMPLSTIDMVMINELGYLPLDQWLEDSSKTGSIAQLGQAIIGRYQLQKDYSFTVNRDRIELLEAMSQAERYQELSFSHYVSILDKDFEKQFAAVVMEIPSLDYAQVIFRGTDETFIGWKEDFKMTYMSEIPAQRQAKSYLTELLAEDRQKKVVVTGHSKGGNLGLFAASQVEASYQEQISYVLLLDAPGLHEAVLDSPGYQAIRLKVCALRPKDSIVGSMLNNTIKGIFVESQVPGLMQHNVMTWEIIGTAWSLVAGPSELSQALEVTFREWTKELGKPALKIYFDTIFDLFLQNDLDSIDEFRQQLLTNIRKILLALGQLPADKRQHLTDSTLKLLSIFVKSSASQVGLPKITAPKDFQDWLLTYLKKD